MIYLSNTTDAQAVFIPKGGDSATGTLHFSATSTVELSTPVDVTVLDLDVSDLYFYVALALPEGMADGEYRYELRSDDALLSQGLLVVGAPARGSAPEGTKQYNENITYEQFNG